MLPTRKRPDGGSALSGLREALRRDETLWELLTTPLFLNLVAVTYQGRSREGIGEARTLQGLRSDVLAAYARRMLERVPATPTAGYDRQDVVRWLRWMATAMTSAAQSVFHLDLIQASWLPFVTHRRLVTIGVSAALGLLASLLTGLVLALDTGRRLGAGFEAPYILVFAAALGLGIAIVGYQPRITPTVRLWWSRETCSRSLRGLTKSASIATAVIAPAFGLAAALVSSLGPPADLATPTPVMPAEEGLLVLVQVAGACAGLAAIVALTAGIEERFAIEAPHPGHAMTTTRRNWLVGTFLFGLPAALVFLLASQVLGQWVAASPLGPERRISYSSPLLPLVLIDGAVAGLAVGPLVRLALPVEPGRRLRDGLLLAVAAAAVLGPAQFAVVRIFGSVGVPLGFWLVPGVPVWPFAGMVAGLIVVFGGSTRRGAIAALIAAITAGTVFVHQGSIALFARFPSSIWLMWVVGIPLAVGMRLGGSAFLRHWTLRWLLGRDDLLPWDCLPFFDHMTRLHILRRRGGGYEFIHRLLQEHFQDSEHGGNA